MTMMSNIEIKHNKKRNVWIIYELLLRSVSEYLIEGDKEKAQKALNIITKHYKSGSEIIKEFRLFSAFSKTVVSSTPVAAAILTETKHAIRQINCKKLDSECSGLIRDVNVILNDKMFYHRRIPRYKDFATIQSMVNEWRAKDRSDIVKMVMLEGKVVEMMMTHHESSTTHESLPDVDNLVVKIMNDKFNVKYSGKLSQEQASLIREYVMMSASGPTAKLIDQVKLLKDTSLSSLATIEKTMKNDTINESLIDVRNRIQSLDLSILDDEKFSKLMTLAQLVSEVGRQDV